MPFDVNDDELNTIYERTLKQFNGNKNDPKFRDTFISLVQEYDAYKKMQAMEEEEKAKKPSFIETLKQSDIPGAFKQGYKQSVTGLAFSDKMPEYQAPKNPIEGVAQGIGMVTGDLPWYAGGALLGIEGGPITMAGGAFGLAEGMRQYYKDQLEKGNIKNYDDFVQRLGDTINKTITGWNVGAMTSAVGSAAPKGLKTASEVGTMVGTQALQEGRMPTAQEFIDAGLLIGTLKAAGIPSKLARQSLERTGKLPEVIEKELPPELSQKIKENPQLIDRYEEVGTQLQALGSGAKDFATYNPFEDITNLKKEPLKTKSVQDIPLPELSDAQLSLLKKANQNAAIPENLFEGVNKEAFAWASPEKHVEIKARDLGLPEQSVREVKDSVKLIQDNEKLQDIITEADIADVARRQKDLINIPTEPTFGESVKKQFLGGMDAIVAKETKAGKELVDSLKKVSQESERLAGDPIGNIEKVRTEYKLSTKPDEWNHIKNILEGKEKPKDERYAKVAEEVKKEFNRVADAAEKSGITIRNAATDFWEIKKKDGFYTLYDEIGKEIDVFKYKKDAEQALKEYRNRAWQRRENYFPREVDLDKLKQRQKDAILYLANNIMQAEKKKGNLIRKEEALALAQQRINIFMKRNAERRYEHLQYSRSIELPEWAYKNNNYEILVNYLQNAWKRLHEAKNFGAKDEKLKQLIDRIAEEGGDAAMAQRMLDYHFGRKDMNNLQ